MRQTEQASQIPRLSTETIATGIGPNRMENPASIVWFRLPAECDVELSRLDFWDTVHAYGTEVDCLRGYNHEMVEIVLDCMASELRIALLHASRCIHFPGTRILGVLDRHAANVLRTRLERHVNTDAKSIFQAYGLSIATTPNARDWRSFFSRQSRHLQSTTDQLLIVCIDANPEHDG